AISSIKPKPFLPGNSATRSPSIGNSRAVSVERCSVKVMDELPADVWTTNVAESRDRCTMCDDRRGLSIAQRSSIGLIRPRVGRRWGGGLIQIETSLAQVGVTD